MCETKETGNNDQEYASTQLLHEGRVETQRPTSYIYLLAGKV